jgi:lipoate-protein ligase A
VRLLSPSRFADPVVASGYTLTVFEEVASGQAPATVSILPSARHVGVTRRDTTRPGFEGAVRAANAEGYPVLVRGAGGGATAADVGTFGFSITRQGDDERMRNHRERYDEAAAFVLGAFARLGISAEVGEVRDEFCPGDHSLRIGGPEGMKIVGIAQRVTRRATSVGGIVLVHGHEELARVLELVYRAMDLPFRPASVGSLRRAGYEVGFDEVTEGFAAEAEARYGAERVPVGETLLEEARRVGRDNLVVLPAGEGPR